MQKRLLIVSSLVLGSVLLFGKASHDAAAQDKQIAALSPQSGWSVSRIDGNENTSDSYCALSRQYDQGIILTLGRNAAEEYSLAIDFQAATLNPERPYSLTLQPGPGQIRAYEMMPASKRAMVVRLGYDDSFFSALEKSGELKAEVDGSNYQFNVTNFTAGKTDLDNCLSGIKGAPETKVAKSFSAEKIDGAAPMVEKKISVDKVVSAPAPTPAPKADVAEVKKEVTSKKIEIAKVDAVMEKPVPAPAAAEKPMAAVKISDAEPPEQPLMAVKEEPKKITSRKIEISRVETTQIAPAPKTIARMESGPEVSVPEPIVLTPAVAKPSPAPKVEKVEIVPPPSEPVKIAAVEKQEPKPVKIEAPEKPAMVSNINKISKVSRDTKTNYNIRSNNDALLEKTIVSKQTADSKPQPVETQITQTSAQKKQREALEQLRADNERLNSALQAELNKPEAVVPDRSAEVSALQSQIDMLQSELMKVKSEPNEVDAKLQADIENLKSENEQLKLNMQARLAEMEQEKQRLAAERAAAEAKKAAAEEIEISRMAEVEEPQPAVDPEMVRQLEKLKEENARLSSAVQGQEQKMAAFDSASPEAEAQLAAMRAEAEKLRAENKRLYDEALQARSNIDTAVVETGNQAFKKIREYEKKLEAAQNDNLALSKEIEELRRLQEDGRLAAVSGDWDLEKATKRYNEAEREIKRLGMLLEQQRVAHRHEKGELEQMLFDPAVTDQEQRRRLTELELQLAAAERELSAAGKRMPARPSTRPVAPLAPAEERVSVTGITPEPNRFVEQQRDNLEMQRLNNKIARQNQQLKAYNRAQREAERMAAVPAAPVQRAQPVAMQQPQPAPRTPEPVRQPAPQPQLATTAFDQGNLQQLLQQAGVPLSGNVTKQAAGQYRWSAGRVTGQAQIVSQSQVGSVDQFVQGYISRAKQSCGGDFASLPSANAAGNIAAYEIACISPTRSTSSSIIFTQKGNDLIAIAHESSADDMDAAMDARDRVASSL